jgi:PKD repeat protein
MKKIFLLLCLLLFQISAQANQFSGGNITYVNLGGDSILVSVKLFEDCNGFTTTSGDLVVYDSAGNSNKYAISFSTQVDITPVCDNKYSRCYNSSSSFFFGEHQLTATSLLILKGCRYYLSFEQCCRPPAYASISNPGNGYFETYIDKCAVKNISSLVPAFQTPFLMYKNMLNRISFKAIDPDQENSTDDDSIAYKMVGAQSAHLQNETYVTGYRATYPLRCKGYPVTTWDASTGAGFYFNEHTGEMMFTPTEDEYSPIVVALQKYHRTSSGWVLISSVNKEILAIVLDQTSHIPYATGLGTPGVFTQYLKAGVKKCIDIESSDADTADLVQMDWDKSIKGATFSINGSKKPTATICWNPDSSLVRDRPYYFTVVTQDQNCPLLGISQQEFAFYVGLNEPADFTMSDTTCPGQTVQFKNLTYTLDSTLKFKWDFGDGSTSTISNPSHKYSKSGVFMVKMEVADNKGVYDTKYKKMYIVPVVVADFTVNKASQCIGSNDFDFKNTSLFMYNSSDIYWNFGDSQTSAKNEVNFSYQDTGTYKVSLVVKSQFGCIDSISKLIKVYPSGISFSLETPPVQCLSSNLFSFNHLSDATFQKWNFGDGKFSTLDSPTHSYSEAGEYFITLSAVDSAGCLGTYSTKVKVTSPEVTFSITSDTLQCIGNNSFTFKSSSPARSYTWSFGDGTYVPNSSAQHSYNNAGKYLVTLILTDSAGCQARTSKTIEVKGIRAGFELSTDSEQCLTGNSFSVKNVSPGLSWKWDFGNDSSSIVQSPLWSYKDTGHYAVKLIFTDTSGCVSEIIKNVLVKYANARFSLSDSVVCTNENFAILPDNISGTSVWDMGDGNKITTNPASYRYATAGTYTISRTQVLNSCSDKFSSSIRVEGYPQLTITGLSQIYLQDTPFYSIKVSGGKITAFKTNGRIIDDMGNGNYVLHWDSAGEGFIAVTAISPAGCEDTFIKKITVNLNNGIISNSKSNENIYPNPFNFYLLISAGIPGEKTFRLTDMGGKIVKYEKSANSRIELNTAELPSGIYMLEIQSKDHVSRYKVVKMGE